MKIRARERQDIINKGRTLFADDSAYSDDEIIGYWRLMKAICEDSLQLSENSVVIEKLKVELLKLSIRHQQIVELRIMKGYTLREMSERLSVSGECVRLNQERLLKKLRRNLDAYSIIEQSRRKMEKETFLHELMMGAKPSCDLSISDMDFSLRVHNCLIKEGIDTIGKLLARPKDILNIGPKGKEEIELKIKQFFPGGEPPVPLTSDIEALGVTARYCKPLRNAGITTMKHAYDCTRRDFEEIPGMTLLGVKKIVHNMKKLYPSWQPYGDLESCPEGEVHIYHLKLSYRSYNALALRGVTKICQINAMSDKELKSIPNIGQKSIKEIRMKVKDFSSKNI